MRYSFFAYGHQNILATHKTTFEFTKGRDLTKKGDCVIGINSDFDAEKIKDLIKPSKNKNIEIVIESVPKGNQEKITAEINKGFCSDHEIVVRMGEFCSERTLCIRANKSSRMLNRGLAEFLKTPNSKIKVTLFFSE